MTEHETETAAAAALALAGADPVPLVAGRVVAFRNADGSPQIVDASQWLDRPARTTRGVELADVSQLVAYLGAQLEGPAEVWADESRGRITAILDAPTGFAPAWMAHHATLTLASSPEWSAWASVSGKMMSQSVFAEFVEDHAADIVRPESAVMLELAQSFQASNKVTFESSRFLDSGRRALEFREDLQAKAGRKGEIEIPATIDLGLAPWVGVDRYRVVARLRYRISDGVLTLGVKLTDPEAVLRAAFADVVAQLGSLIERDLRGAAVELYRGRP